MRKRRDMAAAPIALRISSETAPRVVRRRASSDNIGMHSERVRALSGNGAQHLDPPASRHRSERPLRSAARGVGL
jgi:hypothetical protein